MVAGIPFLSLLPVSWSPDGTKIIMDSWDGPYLVDASDEGAKLMRIRSIPSNFA